MLFRLIRSAFRGQSGTHDQRARLQHGYSRLLADDAAGASAIATELLARAPDWIQARLLLAQAAAAQNRQDEARASVARILVRDPRNVEALYLRGLLEEQQNRADAAIADFGRVLDVDPAHMRALERKGALHDGRGEFDAALACAHRLIELDPHSAIAHDRLGITLRELGRLDLAAEAFQNALALDPHLHLARCHLALVRVDQGRFREAEAELDVVLAAQSNHPDARWTRAVCALLQGRFDSGWEDYEYRESRREIPPFLAGIPEWNGAAVREGGLLVYAEQGLGDQIMFASCLPDVLALAPASVVECDPKLQSLFQRSFPDARIVASGSTGPDDWDRSLPGPVTARIALGSLPRLFRRSWSAFPAHHGYLHPDPTAAARWRSRLDALGPGLKVGLSWTGGTAKTQQRFRSMSLEQLLPVLRISGCQFVNLQYVDSAMEIAAVANRHGVRVHDLEDAHASYDETAALVGALDLVISVCTAVAHLAGAVGTPVWTLTPETPEWRYLAVGERMPWYPEARIWRQGKLGDWSEVIEKIAVELTATAVKHHAPNDSGAT